MIFDLISDDLVFVCFRSAENRFDKCFFKSLFVDNLKIDDIVVRFPNEKNICWHHHLELRQGHYDLQSVEDVPKL